jgi:hypothetical protein
MRASRRADKGGLPFAHLLENASRGVLNCGPLPLSVPDLREGPRAPAQGPLQIMVLRKQRIPLTHRVQQRPPG